MLIWFRRQQTGSIMERVYVNGEHSTAIMKSMTRLWKERKYCDAVLEINSETVELHKLVLLAASPSIIDKVNDITERGTIVIKLDGEKYSKEAVKLCVQYLYKGVAKLTDTNVKSIARVAQALDIKEILKICSSFQDTFKLVKDENSTDNSDTEIGSYPEDPEELQENLSTALQEALDNIKEIEEKAEDDNINMETQIEIQAETGQSTEFNPKAFDSNPVNYEVKDKVESEKEEIDMRNEDIAEKEVASAKDKVIHPKKIFSCELCGKSYSKKAKLKAHRKSVHEGEVKVFPCSICDHVFTSVCNKKQHELTLHFGIRKHCCIHCGACFAAKNSLQGHLRSKHGDGEILKCGLCEQKFSFTHNLKTHQKTCGKDVIRTFSCNSCSKKFRSFKNLQVHSKYSHGEKTFVCDLCGEKFAYPNSLTRHMYRKHKKQRQEVNLVRVKLEK